MNVFRSFLFLGCLLLGTSVGSEVLEKARGAYAKEAYEEVVVLLRPLLGGDAPESEYARQMAASAYQRMGETHFQNGRISSSIECFDEVIALFPEQGPQHWQRGISLYYANRFEDGANQFLSHQTVNPQDVENAVWHFLCAVRTPDGTLEKARNALIPITQDTRIPMKEIHALFAGNASVEEVIQAGTEGGDRGQFYKDLYLGLYYEAIGDEERCTHHMVQAATNPTSEHYMGDVARTHLLVRSGTKR
ncbi:MAG: hypothetical protein AAF191_16710 [Verrucomicrobiota bacterium]